MAIAGCPLVALTAIALAANGSEIRLLATGVMAVVYVACWLVLWLGFEMPIGISALLAVRAGYASVCATMAAFVVLIVLGPLGGSMTKY